MASLAGRVTGEMFGAVRIIMRNMASFCATSLGNFSGSSIEEFQPINSKYSLYTKGQLPPFLARPSGISLHSLLFWWMLTSILRPRQLSYSGKGLTVLLLRQIEWEYKLVVLLKFIKNYVSWHAFHEVSFIISVIQGQQPIICQFEPPITDKTHMKAEVSTDAVWNAVWKKREQISCK